jgi:hypothetical protein
MSAEETHKQWVSRSHPGEKPCGLRPNCLSQLELTSQHHVPQMPDTEVQDLMFTLLGLGLAFARMGMFVL